VTLTACASVPPATSTSTSNVDSKIVTATGAERRIHLRLLEPGSQLQVKGELRLPLHHPDLDELVLHWTAICRGP